MAKIRPFCAIHPADGLWQRIAALPYDVYSRKEAREEAAKDPLSFLNIDRPETQPPRFTIKPGNCLRSGSGKAHLSGMRRLPFIFMS